MAYYKDTREHIKVLEENNKLVRIKREINIDTELMPLVRWQFRGLPEADRKAFLFENVIDATGKKYNIPVLIASHAASREIYALGMLCKSEDITKKWTEAQLHPIEPILVNDGPVHEEVHMGANLLEHGGLEEIPVPISLPGFDNAPYFSCANWVSKDPETGIRNIGNYRSMIKSPTRTSLGCPRIQHIRTHWDKCRRKGIPLQAAIVTGAVPAVGFVSATKIPYGVDEYSVAGGLAGEPIELVKCKTVDLEVPATAEIVIEGEVPIDSMEREAPFGEYSGYMGGHRVTPYFNVTCITHRHNAIYVGMLSQFPPSESSKVRGIGMEGAVYKFLRYDVGLPVLEVAYHECSGSSQYCVIRLKVTHQSQPWRALNAAVGLNPTQIKWIIVVDEDIDPRDPDAVNWALSFRTQPHLDTRITMGLVPQLDPSATEPGQEEGYPAPRGASAILIDATRKWDYPPVALPKKEFMERAKQIWEEEGLPKIQAKVPWYGYSLGNWTAENEEEALLAIKREFYKTGEKLANQRIKL